MVCRLGQDEYIRLQTSMPTKKSLTDDILRNIIFGTVWEKHE